MSNTQQWSFVRSNQINFMIKKRSLRIKLSEEDKRKVMVRIPINILIKNGPILLINFFFNFKVFRIMH